MQHKKQKQITENKAHWSDYSSIKIYTWNLLNKNLLNNIK